jgi:hypothetical protein
MKFFTLPIALLLLCVAGRAQSNDGTVVLPARLSYKGKVEKKVDRFTGKTSFTLKGGTVYGTVTSGLSFLAYTSLDENEKEPPFYMFSLAITSKQNLRAADPTLYALVDGARKNVGRMIIAADDVVMGFHLVTYSLPISYTELSKLSTAKKVEMKFDDIEFELTDSHRNALLDFLAYSQGR